MNVVPLVMLASIGIPMLKIRQSHDRLIFNMGIPIPGKDGLYIENGPLVIPFRNAIRIGHVQYIP